MEHNRSEVARMRREFWADKEANAAIPAKPGKLEIAAAMAHHRDNMGVALWLARYDAARQPLTVIVGGKV